ncbi:MAG: aldehyde dehydrogenase [Novosphingobium lindaniclasticum]|uniref:aldehyde dehydrogenase family protein n=1 Tax=Novosphingobium lindaniclasticum TaxID=1329895 RepID=UPI002409E7C6|nr:aldehyde dehydrogenase family protein [Novosphingobium lindaniclasticum]MDF2638464.1 aldehyde dehydrogenase [Novosphingobium lindaniclasticum]
MKADFKLLIGGVLVEGASTFDVINPATEQVVAKCPKADPAQLEDAIGAAKAAFPSWSALGYDARGALIEKMADAIVANKDELARLLTAEQGKPLDQAAYEVMGASFVLRAFAGMRAPEKVVREDAGNRVIEHRTPLGVVASITPWNFPLILLANKLGPCLVSGNCMVAKPAPTTPLTTLLLAELTREILPAGVFNVVCDENELGPLLSAHPDVAKVAFTGSTATGKKVMASAATGVKRVTLELGGNDAAIVLDDMVPAVAAQKVYQGAMTNAGQICVAIKRAYVHESIYDEFCEEIARLAEAAVVDDGTKQGTTIGPVQNRMQYDKVKSLIESARDGGTFLAGGELPDGPGFFIPPTIVAGLDDDAPLVREEQFGPVLPVLKFSEVDDVVRRANASEYGLAGTVWGRDLERAMDVARRIDSGTVWVNQHLAIDPTLPFRGSKQSGLGAELGQAGLHEYTQAHIINAVELEEL